MGSPDREPHARTWLEALDLLEQTLASGIAADDHWLETLGPIPPALIPRAVEISRRQADSLAGLASELKTIEHHLSVLKTIPTARALGDSVYLDTTS